MNKKEKEQMEYLETLLALRLTDPVEPDLFPPDDHKTIINGYTFNTHSMEIRKSCTDGISSNFWGWDETTSRGSIKLYSSRLLALKAMRYETAIECAKKLRRIDLLIDIIKVGHDQE